jgi:hypothetical protein
MTLLRGLALCCLLAGSSPVVAQGDWLPPQVESGVVEQLVARMEAIGPRPIKDRAALQVGMQMIVRQVRATLERWEERGVLDRAPAFPKLKLPEAKRSHLTAMGRYQVCNWVLMNQQDEAYDLETRRNGAVASTAMTLAVIYLRQPFLKQGGASEQIEAFLTGTAMDRAFKQTMGSKQWVSYVEQQCQPLITEMFTASR